MKIRNCKLKIVIFVVFFAALPLAAYAETLKSESFQVQDPVITVGGGTSTSANFEITQAFGEFIRGTTSSSNFQTDSGFLTFPTVTDPANVSATAGDSSVDLSWDASVTTGGWSVGGYTVGQATQTGGPYSYSSQGSGTSATISGLSNGTEHFFVIVTEDAFGNHIATSSEVSATPESTEEPSEQPTTGASTQSTPPEEPTRTGSIQINGTGPENTSIRFLVDGVITATDTTSADGTFTHTLSDVAVGVHTFSVYAFEGALRSETQSVTVRIGEDTTATVANVTIPTLLEPLSQEEADVNEDSRVNLADFSILVYWMERPDPPANVDINNDGVINLRDFSILTYRWTG